MLPSLSLLNCDTTPLPIDALTEKRSAPDSERNSQPFRQRPGVSTAESGEPQQHSFHEEGEEVTIKYEQFLTYHDATDAEDLAKYHEQVEALRKLAKDPESLEYQEFAQKMDRWLEARRLLQKIEATLPKVSLTPLYSCDIMGPTLQHLDLVDKKSSRGLQGRGYLWSVVVLTHFMGLETLQANVNVNHLFQKNLLMFLKVAHKKATPWVGAVVDSVLMSEDSEHLIPFLEFWTALLQANPLVLTKDFKYRLVTYHIGQEALECIFGWLDHMWGTASDSPNFGQMKYKTYEEVQIKMKDVSTLWAKMAKPHEYQSILTDWYAH